MGSKLHTHDIEFEDKEKYIIKDLSLGKIKGIEKDGCYEFRGIRYAKAKRWEYPTQVDLWEGEYDATAYGACCFQMRAFEDDAVCNPFYHKEFRQGRSFTYSEDCFFLNIQTPKNAEKLPVLLYIHGGSFTGGSADESQIDGERFCENGVVFVAINYRLGPYGFCSHPALRDSEGRVGNYGLYDQYTAIKWVYDHIEQFGGDREQITLMGQSAGAMSVDIHISSPMTEPLINGAALLSGAGLQRMLLKPLKAEKTEKFWQKVMKNAGVSTMSELGKIDEKTLYYAWLDAQRGDVTSILRTLPVYDGKLLKKETFAAKSIADMPYMVGLTITDMMPLILMRNTKKWAKQCEKNKYGCYTYQFTRLLPGDDKGAWHSCDLLYFFSTLERNWRPFETVDKELSQKMSDSLIAFTKTGNPNCEGVSPWRKGEKAPMIFAESIKSGKWNKDGIVKNMIKKGL